MSEQSTSTPNTQEPGRWAAMLDKSSLGNDTVNDSDPETSFESSFGNVESFFDVSLPSYAESDLSTITAAVSEPGKIIDNSSNQESSESTNYIPYLSRKARRVLTNRQPRNKRKKLMVQYTDTGSDFLFIFIFLILF